jgi:hypothetical protein
LDFVRKLQSQIAIKPMLGYYNTFARKVPTAMMDACVWAAAITHRADALQPLGGEGEEEAQIHLFDAIAGVAKAFVAPDQGKVARWFKQLGLDLNAGFIQPTLAQVS